MAAFLDSVYQTGWRKRQAQAKFWSHVRPRRADECWHWVGSVTEDGYGRFSRWRGHTIMWEMHNGRALPEGMQVCHSCDTPSCVNPYHLFVGTHQDNIDDKMAKGRHGCGNGPRPKSRGTLNHKNKISDDETMRRIIAWKAEGLTYPEIGVRLGVCKGTVSSALWHARRNRAYLF